MENSNSSSSDDPSLITGTLMAFDETSLLPVIVGEQTSYLTDLEQDPLETETLLAVSYSSPVITLHQPDIYLSDAKEEPSDSLEEVVTLEDDDSVEFCEIKGESGEEEELKTEAGEGDEKEEGEEEEGEEEITQTVSIPYIMTDEQPHMAQVLQLEGGTLAYIHTQPQEGSEAVHLEDGTVAYITLSQPVIQSQELTVEEPKKHKSFMCSHEGCGRLYTSSHHLKVHERTHTGNKPYTCSMEGCGKAFSTDYSRKAHVRTHTGEKPYKCPENQCTKCFKTSGDLQKHIRTHTGERPFVCPVVGCNRSFTTSNIRKVHIRTHTGERPYVCPEPSCDKSFASATNYKNHIRIHSGEKPYVCNVEGCNKRFTEYSSLYKHHLVHTQEKPYQCVVCGRSYRQASTLTVHKRTSHGVIEAEDGTEIMLGNVFTQEVIKSANILSDNKKIKAVRTVANNILNNGDLILNSGGAIQRISSEQIFIIEDVPEHHTALQHIQEPDEELQAALDPLEEQ